MTEQTALWRKQADEHLIRHMEDMTETRAHPLDIFERGEGCYIYDSEGKKYLDALSALFCVEIGYSYGDEIAEAAAAQLREIGYHPVWGSTHPRAIELAAVVAELAPEGLNHTIFTSGGGESVETALKLAVQYHHVRGEHRWKAIGRDSAWHGTGLGSLGFMGIAEYRTPFEDLIPHVLHVRNAKRYGRPVGETEEEFTAFLLDDLDYRIRTEDPSTIAMMLIEPVQLHGGVIVPPKGYSEGVRAICDKYGILLVSDETITGWGRCGEWFASTRYNMSPDMITTAKGITSANAPLGAVILSDAVYDVFHAAGTQINHGVTFAGHPLSCAIALKNIEIIKRLDLPAHVRENEAGLRARLDALKEKFAFVKNVSGSGYYYGVELAQEFEDGTPFTSADIARFLDADAIAYPLLREGIFVRLAMDNGDPVLTIAPPLVAGPAEFDVLAAAFEKVLAPINDAYLLGPQ